MSQFDHFDPKFEMAHPPRPQVAPKPARSGPLGAIRRLGSGKARFAAAGIAVAALAGAAILGSAALSGSPNPTPIYIVSTDRPTIAPTVTATPTPSPTPSPTPFWTGSMPPPTPAPPVKLTGYVWPLTNAIITLPFGYSSYGGFLVNGKLFHDGVDMATQCGDKVMAAHDGVVLAAGVHYDDFMGWHGDLSQYYAYMTKHNFWNTKALPNVIVIDDGDGYRSIYAHEAKVSVKVGQHVTAGQTIGTEGATGNASGCHVHFGLFSPLETATYANLPKFMAKPDRLPGAETARIDPFLVLPYRNDIPQMRTLRPSDAAAWAAANPSPIPSAKP